MLKITSAQQHPANHIKLRIIKGRYVSSHNVDADTYKPHMSKTWSPAGNIVAASPFVIAQMSDQIRYPYLRQDHTHQGSVYQIEIYVDPNTGHVGISCLRKGSGIREIVPHLFTLPARHVSRGRTFDFVAVNRGRTKYAAHNTFCVQFSGETKTHKIFTRSAWHGLTDDDRDALQAIKDDLISDALDILSFTATQPSLEHDINNTLFNGNATKKNAYAWYSKDYGELASKSIYYAGFYLYAEINNILPSVNCNLKVYPIDTAGMITPPSLVRYTEPALRSRHAAPLTEEDQHRLDTCNNLLRKWAKALIANGTVFPLHSMFYDRKHSIIQPITALFRDMTSHQKVDALTNFRAIVEA